MKSQKRLVNYDFLKIVSMLMIVSLHYFGFGDVIETIKISDQNYCFVWILEILCLVSVNCFILVSGYLMTDNSFRIRKLINLWIQIVFINICCLVFVIFSGNIEGGYLKPLIKAIFPIIANTYWYMSSYFLFYIISPFLIWIVKRLNITQLRKIVFISLVLFTLVPIDWTKIQNGYSFVWFVILFFFSAYIRKSEKFSKKSSKYFALYLLATAVTFVIKLICDFAVDRLGFANSEFSKIGSHFCYYNSFFIVLASVFLFLSFKNIDIKNSVAEKVLPKISSLTLGVYLIHLNPFVRDWLWKTLVAPKKYIDSPLLAVHFIISIISVFAVCSAIEWLRQLLFKLLHINRLSIFIGDKIEKILKSVFYNKKLFDKL